MRRVHDAKKIEHASILVANRSDLRWEVIAARNLADQIAGSPKTTGAFTMLASSTSRGTRLWTVTRNFIIFVILNVLVHPELLTEVFPINVQGFPADVKRDAAKNRIRRAGTSGVGKVWPHVTINSIPSRHLLLHHKISQDNNTSQPATIFWSD